MAEIEKLPADQKTDTIGLFVAVQNALNAYVREIDREINYQIPPVVFHLMADEHERIAKRLKNN